MEKGLFFLIESEGELAEEAPKLDAAELEAFFKSESSRILELSDILRSLGRRADFEFAQQACYELERELKNARRLMRSIDQTDLEILGRHLEKTTEKVRGIGARKKGKKTEETEKYKLDITHANLATAHIRASGEREFLNGLAQSIEKDFSELETILKQLSPIIKQAYLPPLSNSLEKTLKKQGKALKKIRENKKPEENRSAFLDRLHDLLSELKTINSGLLPFLEKTYEALELLEKALFIWVHLHSLLLKYSQDWGALNKGIGNVLEGADFNSIPQLERKLPLAEPSPLQIPAKQALFLKNRVLEVNGLLTDAQWKLFAKAQGKRSPVGKPAPADADTTAPTAETKTTPSEPQ